jgi:hypothetical protein
VGPRLSRVAGTIPRGKMTAIPGMDKVDFLGEPILHQTCEYPGGRWQLGKHGQSTTGSSTRGGAASSPPQSGKQKTRSGVAGDQLPRLDEDRGSGSHPAGAVRMSWTFGRKCPSDNTHDPVASAFLFADAIRNAGEGLVHRGTRNSLDAKRVDVSIVRVRVRDTTQ